MARAEGWMGRLGDEIREMMWGGSGQRCGKIMQGEFFLGCVGFHSEGDRNIEGFSAGK